MATANPRKFRHRVRLLAVQGAAVLVAGYVLTLVLFAAVQWLQYWDYARR